MGACCKASVRLGFVFLMLSDSSQAQTNPNEPPKSGLIEHAESRSIQQDISIEIKDPRFAGEAAHLTKDDFFVFLGRQELSREQFEVDNFCPEREVAESTSLGTPPPARGHIALYIDYSGLSFAGMVNTHVMLKNMIPDLVSSGHQVLLTIQRGRMQTIVDWSSDAETLLLPISDDNQEQIQFAQRPSRAGIEQFLLDGEVDKAIELADHINLSEQVEYGRGANYLSELVRSMSNLLFPKAIIYFSDRVYGQWDEVVTQATLAGVRIYPILAGGLAPPGRNVPLHLRAQTAVRSGNVSLSRRTGGRATYGGRRRSASRKILGFIRSDFACIYVFSFDPGTIEVARYVKPKIVLRPGLRKYLGVSKARLILLDSESDLREAEIETAFSSSRTGEIRPASVHVLPVGLVGSRVQVEIQFALELDSSSTPALPELPVVWDLGVSHAAGYAFTEDANLRVTALNPNRLVFNRETQFSDGTYAVVGVGMEENSSVLSRGQTSGTFKKPQKRSFGFMGSLTIMQEKPGVYLSYASDEVSTQNKGWLAASYDMIATNFQTRFVGLLCRGPKHNQEITIEKQFLLPDGREVFGASTIWSINNNDETQEENRCKEITTGVDSSEFTWNDQPYKVTYTLTASDEAGQKVAEISKRFWVIGPRE